MSKWNDKYVISKLKGSFQSRMKMVGEFALMVSKALVLVDTGNLRGSINYKVYREKGAIVCRIGTPVEYAPYVEFGTGEFAENGQGRQGGWTYVGADGKGHFTLGMKPQPFLRPIITTYKGQIQRILAL